MPPHRSPPQATGQPGAQTAKRLPPDLRKGRQSFARAAGSFVPRLTAKVFEKYGFHSAEIMTSWATVIGADIAAISAPERLRWPRASVASADGGAVNAGAGATLILRVEPAHALDIEYRAGEIVDRINRYFGYRAVTTMKILQAPLAQPPSQKMPAWAARPDQHAPAHVEAIAGDELKAALTRLWGSLTAEREAR